MPAIATLLGVLLCPGIARAGDDAIRDVTLKGEVVSSIALTILSTAGGVRDARPSTRELDIEVVGPTLAPVSPVVTSRRGERGSILEAGFAIDVYQTGATCAQVLARLSDDSTEVGRVFLHGGDGPPLALDGRPRPFTTVRVTHAVVPALLSVVVPDRREPGPLKVKALFETTWCPG